MDAHAATPELAPVTGWLARERANGRIYRFAKLGSAVLLVVVL
ncbi:MAG: hypothetical protein JWO65_44, partial [Sphingomonas bacterium]|nr:hypothetical protein [Sphingomonas bacterium]